MNNRRFFGICFALLTLSTGKAQTLKDAIRQTTNEQFETADASFKALQAKEPANGEVYFYFGENYFKNDNLAAADAKYQEGIAANATNALNYVGAGKVQWYNKKDQDAKSNFFKALTLSQNKNATVMMKIAEAYINGDIKDVPEALKLLTQAQKLEPKNPEVFLLTGDAYLEQNNGTEAVKWYEKAVELDKTSPKAALRMGQLWNRSKNYTEALNNYKKATDLDPSFAPAYRERGDIYFRAGQYQNAIAQYQKYLELNNNLSAKIRYVGFLVQAKQYKDALSKGNEVIMKDSSNIYLYRYLGYAHYENAEYPAGLMRMEIFFKRADKEVRIIPQDYEYYGKLLAKTGKDSLGIVNMLKAAEMDTTKKDVYSEIGAAYFKMKKYPESIAAYNKKIAASAKPGANDNFGVGRAYFMSKDFVNADSAFVKITRSNPDLPLGYIWRAKANANLDPKNEKWLAKPYYEAVIAKVKPEEVEKNKKDLVEAYTYIGVYYLNQKDYTNAKVNFKKVLELDPNNANAKKFMASPEAQGK